MARSALTLAAAATAAVPGLEIVEASPLTTGTNGRNDAAMATLVDGRRVAVRIPLDESADADLAAEALALRALTDGVRSLVSFAIPEFLGAAPVPEGRVFVTTFIPGYQVPAASIPAGRGVAASLGAALAAIHALPESVVRGAGLPVRTASDVRDEVRRVLEESSATGRVPVRLMVRWRDVIDDDAVWQFEPAVSLGGASATSFVYDEVSAEPAVVGVIDWHGLQVADPALDLQFLTSAPEAVDTVHSAYAAASHRAPDESLRVRARLHAELEFARWLLHGRDQHREDVMDDAAALLDSLADGVRDNTLRPTAAGSDIDDAVAALGSVPEAARAAVDTSMQTDAYDPEKLGRFLDGDATQEIAPGFFAGAGASPDEPANDPNATQALDRGFYEDDVNATQEIESGFFGQQTLFDEPDGESDGTLAAATPEGDADVADAERAADATLRRWAQD
ncbi:phosphotransferase [Microbacterium gorillae]|uniref:phosphotransferase n=1 Tax=Microbacterium gorillae TaxID=1231063 RepID=UPI000694641B|nr:phosphotransferase [Microbacterium gorillae]